MFKLFKKPLKNDVTKAIVDKVCESDSDLTIVEKLETIHQLRNQLSKSDETVSALIRIVRHAELGEDNNLDIAKEIFEHHSGSEEAIIELASTIENLRNIDLLNDPPPEDVFFENMLQKLVEVWAFSKDKPEEKDVVEYLSGFARLTGRKNDEIAETAYKRTIDLYPEKSWPHYNWGLFCKTRARFAEGVAANKKAIEISEKPSNGSQWNLGICATGAGATDTALKIWKELGNNIEAGRFDLPEGKYASVKVSLAEFPVAERPADKDYPGQEETIWIERLSPCHGIIQSVLYEDLGINYGDVILFDGAPLTYHTYGERQIPVFPHLTTLLKRNYQFYDFMGIQEEQGQLMDLTEKLSADSIIYPHSELYQILCNACYMNPDSDHSEHTNENREEYSTVSGRIAAPPDVKPGQLLNEIDAALKGRSGNRIFSPELCIAAQKIDRSKFERKRFEELSHQ